MPLSCIAQQVGTPVYVYSAATLTRHFLQFRQALDWTDHLICFAVKANSNLAVLRLLGGLGAGMDVVSGGEYARARAAGVPGERIVFSGVGKTRGEMAAALKAGILCFMVLSPFNVDIAGPWPMLLVLALLDAFLGPRPYLRRQRADKVFGQSERLADVPQRA